MLNFYYIITVYLGHIEEKQILRFLGYCINKNIVVI